jgi:trigger factor
MMSKTEVREISPTVREIKVTIEPEKVREVYNKISRAFAKTASIPGFRKGLAPLDLVRIHYKDEIKERVFSELVRDEVVKAIEETGLHILSEEPQIFVENYKKSNLNGTEEVSIKAVFEVMPEISKPEYECLEVVRRTRPVMEKMIEEYIEERRRASAVFVPIEGRKSEMGDTVIADVRGWFLDESRDESALDLNNPDIEVEDAEILLGDKAVKSEFSDSLVGVEEDDEREFVVRYGEDYFQKELAGKTIKYRLKIKSVGKVEIPELDDAWAQSLDEGYESLADFREKIRKNLGILSKLESDERLQDAVVEELLKKNPIEVPLTLVHHQANFLLRNILSEFKERGFEVRNADERTLRELHLSLIPKAERQVRAALILDKIAEIEKIEVNDEDLQKELELIARINKLNEEEKKRLLENERLKKSLEDNIRVRKTIQRIIEKAKVIEGEWIEDSTAGTEKVETAGSKDSTTAEDSDVKDFGIEKSNAEKLQAETSGKPEA